MDWIIMVFRMLEVVLGIGLVIFVHELGHFLVAKRVGIRVEVFSLGFGPRLLGFRRGHTDYRVSAVPLGGYVKMAGENPDEEATGAADEFAAKPVGARAAVIVAGVCMNAIFAVLGFLIAFKIGVRMDHAAVGRVQPGSAAEEAGLCYGDRVVRIGDEKPLEFMDIGLAAAYASGPLDVVVDRRGERHELRVKPRRSVGSPVQQLGFERMDAVHAVARGSAAEKAGFRPGDWITAVDGRPVASFADYAAAVRDGVGKTLAVEVRRGDELATLTLAPTARPARTYGIALASIPVVGKVIAGSPAAEAGILAGDAVLATDGVPADVATFRDRVAGTKAGDAIKLTIERDGAKRDIAVVPRRDGTDGTGPLRIGAQFGRAVVGSVAPGSPAAMAGIAAGDRIAAADGQRPMIFSAEGDDLDRVASKPEAEKDPLALTIVKAGSATAVEAKLTPAAAPGRSFGEDGLEMAFATFEAVSPGVVEPIRLGLNRTKMFMEQVFLTFQGMFAKRIDPSTLGGPIGIAETAYRVAEHGLGRLLYFLAIISVNLAVLNIFPIPILDGGHLVFLGLEKLKGRPVSPNVQVAAQWVGLALLLGLMIFVTKNDIVRWFGG